jgi:predicted phage terminase large subunit-like protein
MTMKVIVIRDPPGLCYLLPVSVTDSVTGYDFDEIASFLHRGESWRWISSYYGKKHPAAMRWFKRQEAKQTNQVQVIQRVVVPGKRPSSPFVETPISEPFSSLLERQSSLNWSSFCQLMGVSPLPYQDRWVQLIETNKKIMILAPRGHGKSWIMMLRIIYFLLKSWPNGTVLFVTSTSGNAKKVFRQVLRAFKSNPAIHAFLGTADTIANSNLQTKEIWFPRDDLTILDPSLLCCGRGTEIIGAHPDQCYFEDILQKMSKKEETEENLKEWHDGTVEYLETVDTEMIWTGTRKGKGDLYEHVQSTGQYEVVVSPAIKLKPGGRWPEHGDFIWENNRPVGVRTDTSLYETLDCPWWPVDKLLTKRFINYVKFEREMQNNVIPEEGLYFDPDEMCYYDSLPPTSSTVLSMHCDPAFGKKENADFTAIVVVAWQSNMNRFFVLDHVLKRGLDFNDIIDTYCEIYFKWKRLNYAIINASIEDNFMQTWLLSGFKKQVIPVTGLSTRKNKIERIASLKPGFRQRLFYFNKTNADYQEALYQIARFDQTPSTAMRKDDFLDALEAAYARLGVVNYERGSSFAYN